ncbi:MAG: PCRF domain-containing protein, partial [Desulfatitalea sp.]|nr:PCRF domain-containing protein [Desulfatitalea sp.]
MFEKLSGVEDRFKELEGLLSNPKILQDRAAFQKYAREHAELNAIVAAFREYRQLDGELDESLELLKDSDPEIKHLAKEEIDRLEQRKQVLEKELKL